MNQRVEWKQTTQGIDCIVKDNKLILDTEGLDSREKW